MIEEDTLAGRSSNAIELLRFLDGSADAGSVRPRDDWPALAELALEQDLGSALYLKLKECGEILSGDIARQLRFAHHTTAALALRDRYTMMRVLGALREAGLAVIGLKGAVLSEIFYKNPATRQMADIDLLVRREQMEAAVECMTRLGFRSGQPFDPITEQSVNHEMPPLYATGVTPIELHWTLVTPRYPGGLAPEELDALWSRSVPVYIGGMRVLSLSPADLLLHLCIHVSVQHRLDYRVLQGLLDIARVCRRHAPAMDWPAFAERAKRWNVSNGVCLALTLVRDWLRVEVPAAVLIALNAEAPDAATMDWIKDKVQRLPPSDLQSESIRFAGNASIRDHVRAIRGTIAPLGGSFGRMVSKPRSTRTVLAYYPTRVWQLWTRHSRVLWQLARRDEIFMRMAKKELRLRRYLGWR